MRASQRQDPCLATVGCTAGFSCVANVFAAGTTCVQQCTQSTDCQSTLKICVPQLISPSQAGCGFAGCGMDYYDTCDAQGTADGTCIPFIFGATTALGICVQGGTLGENQPCASQRGSEETSQTGHRLRAVHHQQCRRSHHDLGVQADMLGLASRRC